MTRLLQGLACVVIIMYGIRVASHILVLLLMAILLAYAFVPLPQWIMQRFRFGKIATLVSTLVVFGTLSVVTIALLYDSVIRMTEILPTYHQHFIGLFDKLLVFARAHGLDFSASNASASHRLLEFARMALREAGKFLEDGLLISILALIFMIEMVEASGIKQGRLAAELANYGSGVQHYIAISAKTGLITATANLIVLVAVGVDFPVFWCVLYFFLHFIPNVGFIFALIPPSLLALVMLGWKKALVVGGSMIVTQLLTDYGLTPVLMKKGVHISFLETMVSLMVWGFLLGPAGAILAIPLTLTLKKFIQQLSAEAAPNESAIAVTSGTQSVATKDALAGAA